LRLPARHVYELCLLKLVKVLEVNLTSVSENATYIPGTGYAEWTKSVKIILIGVGTLLMIDNRRCGRPVTVFYLMVIPRW
jgi:hypothetical protein